MGSPSTGMFRLQKTGRGAESPIVLFESVTSALFMMKPKPDKSSVISEMPPGRPSAAESNRDHGPALEERCGEIGWCA